MNDEVKELAAKEAELVNELESVRRKIYEINMASSGIESDLEYLKDMGGEDTEEIVEDFRHGRADDGVINFLEALPGLIRDIEKLLKKLE